MPEKIGRREFLKDVLALGAVAAAGDLACELPDRKETEENKKKPALTAIEQTPLVESRPPMSSSRFLGEEIEMLTESVAGKNKMLVLAELKRIEKHEAAKLSARRFSNSREQMVKYFAPFLEKKENIEAAIEAADPEQKVPRKALWGLIGMESGGKDAFNEATGAAGIFQLTADTARALGLKVGKGNDERLDLAKAAKVVVKYLLEQHERFGKQWGLALAAYAGGPTRLEGRIRKKFKLRKETLTQELLKEKLINIVTLYSRKFKFLGTQHSVQYPFGAQAMAQWMSELMEKEKQDHQEEGESALAQI